MPKSLYGYERFQERKILFEKESVKNYIKFEAKIIEVLSNYKELCDLMPNLYKEAVSILETDFVINSGVHFLIVLENGDFSLVESPYSEDELRSIYGSDGNIKGRILEILALDMTLHSILYAESVKMKSSAYDQLQDHDMYLPINLGGLLGGNVDGRSKMNRFKYNNKSGYGVMR